MNSTEYPASFAQEALNHMYANETEDKDPLKPLLQEISSQEKHPAKEFFQRLKDLYNACLDHLANAEMDFMEAAREDDRFFTVVSLMNYYEAASNPCAA